VVSMPWFNIGYGHRRDSSLAVDTVVEAVFTLSRRRSPLFTCNIHFRDTQINYLCVCECVCGCLFTGRYELILIFAAMYWLRRT